MGGSHDPKRVYTCTRCGGKGQTPKKVGNRTLWPLCTTCGGKGYIVK